jgi:putative SOS response-associated peptidase YedK
MCNLYCMTKTKDAMRQFPLAFDDRGVNMPSLPGIYPDYSAPIVRNNAGTRELAMVRWGMPSPKQALVGKKTDRGVTNVRNTNSGHWRRWLGVENRCLVPLTSFSENEVLPDGCPGRRCGLPSMIAVLSPSSPHLGAEVEVRTQGQGRRDRV